MIASTGAARRMRQVTVLVERVRDRTPPPRTRSPSRRTRREVGEGAVGVQGAHDLVDAVVERRNVVTGEAVEDAPEERRVRGWLEGAQLRGPPRSPGFPPSPGTGRRRAPRRNIVQSLVLRLVPDDPGVVDPVGNFDARDVEGVLEVQICVAPRAHADSRAVQVRGLVGIRSEAT